MTSPEWPKFQFKDGRKRMTLPIVDGKGNGEEDSTTTPRSIRLNSTESALKKTKSDGKKASTSRLSSSRHRKSSKEGSEWMSKESIQREIKLRRSTIDSRPETLPDTVPGSHPETLPDTVPDSRPETLADTVPENTVGENRLSKGKKISGTPLRALENFKSGEKKKEKEKPQNLPDPLTALMLERAESVRKEMEMKRRREERMKGNDAAPAATTAAWSKIDGGGEGSARPFKQRKKSLFQPSNKKITALKRRASFDGAVAFLGGNTVVARREDTVADGKDKTTIARRMSVSPSGGLKDRKRDPFVYRGKTEGRKEGEEESVGRLQRRSSEGGAIADWVAPSLQDFKSGKQRRRSSDTAKEKESTVPVLRKLTSVVPPTPMTSEKEGGEKGVSFNYFNPISPTASDFTPKNGRKKSTIRSIFFGEKGKKKENEDDTVKVKPQTQLSWGRLADAIYRKTSVRSEVSIASTVPGEFEDDEVALEREQERANSIDSLKSDKSEEQMKNPIVNRFLSSISLATTRGPSSTGSVVKDSLEEDEEEPNDDFKPLFIEDDSPPDEFEIKDTVQEGAPKPIKFTKPSGLGLFRRPLSIDPLPSEYGHLSSFSPPPPSRRSSGGSTTSANPRGRRQMGVTYEDKLCKQLEKELAIKRSDRTLLKHDNSSVASIVLTVDEDRSCGWGVSLYAHSRGHVIAQSNVAPPEGTCVRVALPLSCVLDSVAVAPTVL